MSHLDYWHEKWKASDTPGFHRPVLVPAIEKLQHQIIPEDKSMAIFIPLCGKALEIKHFIDLGCKIIGLEFSEKAIYLLSEENQFGLQESAIEGFGKVFQNAEKSIQIYCGDLFEFSKDTLVENCEIGAVIDKGSFVAIDPEMREKYLQVMASFVESPKCRYMMCLYDHDMGRGPPHVVQLEYACVKLGQFGFKMIDYFKGEPFFGLSEKRREEMRVRGATTFTENTYFFVKN